MTEFTEHIYQVTGPIAYESRYLFQNPITLHVCLCIGKYT